METIDPDRVRLIAAALADALAKRHAVLDDIAGIAAEIARALAGEPASSPPDPEGDGLAPAELNAANDL